MVRPHEMASRLLLQPRLEVVLLNVNVRTRPPIRAGPVESWVGISRPPLSAARVIYGPGLACHPSRAAHAPQGTAGSVASDSGSSRASP